MLVRAGTGYAHDQAEVGNKTIVATEYGCPYRVSSDRPVTLLKPCKLRAADPFLFSRMERRMRT